jgi:hypothetical protein
MRHEPRSSNVEERGDMRTLLVACALAAAALCGAAPQASAAQSHRADAADDGYLDVASDPAAKIVIDGADTGKITPQSHLELKAGHHKLTLVTIDGAHSRTIGFTVQAGQTTKLTIHLAS